MDKNFKQLNEKTLTDVVGGDSLYGNHFGSVQKVSFLNKKTAEEARQYLEEYGISGAQAREYMELWKAKHS